MELGLALINQERKAISVNPMVRRKQVGSKELVVMDVVLISTS